MSEVTERQALSRDALLRILDVSQKLAASYDLMQLLNEVVEAGQEVLLAERGSLWLYEAAQRELVLKIPVRVPEMRVPANKGLVGECLSSKAIINVPDAYADNRFSQSMDHQTGYRTHSILSIPLLGRNGEPVGVMQLLNKQGGVFEHSDELLASALAAQCAVALQRTQMTEALLLKERLDEEVSLAREIQMGTLPDVMPNVPGYDLHAVFLPTEQTGGDTFDLVVLNDRLFMLMGDATGHGFGPALSATQMQSMLRVAFRCGASLEAAYTHVNNQLSEDLPDDRFVTAFMGLLDPGSHQLEYFSGGQGPLLFFHSGSREFEWRGPTTFPLGVMDIDSPGTAQEYIFEPGDVLALLSDGIYEYVSDQGAEFGQQRVEQWLADYHHLPANEMGKQLMQSVREFGAGADQLDDITAVIIKRLDQTAGEGAPLG
ncbi:MAG TPA: GAF domain-containing SpoIIE family protein phosphatase [Xanthomonadales bacterium]|nr:GAF domain-containing SpoIIE family protein phosphatase [Xanthomonadales bacterium]